MRPKVERRTRCGWLLRLVVLMVALLVVPAARAQSAKVAITDSSVIDALLLKSFGPTVETVKDFTPYHLTGDFNGDGIPDTLIVVRIKGHRSELSKDVKVLNPFYKTEGPAYPDDPKNKPTLALAIIHGGTNPLPNSPPRKFLLVGESPVLAMEDSRTRAQPDARKDLIELMKKKARRPRGSLPLPAKARGDAVLLGTEAADSFLYWDGKTYRWEESEGGE
ncbi:MAG TPA: hypothetical protein VLL54_18725 [Pyrinomonadaceae bacterium]|nr:hypothetical protein [Pyrinomonadaceae bacterium]